MPSPLENEENGITLNPHAHDAVLLLLNEMVAQGSSPARQLTSQLISALPRLTEEQIASGGHTDSCCPICLVPLLALVTEEEMALAMESPAHSIEDLGVTRLVQCGHHFCRRDISKWMREGNTSCPTCRRPFDESLSSNRGYVSIEDPLSNLSFAVGVDTLDEGLLDRAFAAFRTRHEGAVDINISSPPSGMERRSPGSSVDNEYSAMYS
jgi:hypothetical protein